MQEMSNAFTGGDYLTGILSYYSKILMENELNKGYSEIDQHSARHFVYYGECLSNPLPFYAVK